MLRLPARHQRMVLAAFDQLAVRGTGEDGVYSGQELIRAGLGNGSPLEAEMLKTLSGQNERLHFGGNRKVPSVDIFELA